MRIIAGKHKGRRITAPKNLPVRPTTDRAKEAVFNILNHRFYFDEISFLDLFAGTGSLSFEAASRGIATIMAVDRDKNCIQFIEKTAQLLQLTIETRRTNVFKYLTENTKSFDLIMADPPYDLPADSYTEIVTHVFDNSWLNENGLLILEHSTQHDFSHLPQFREQRNYGGCVFSFFEVSNVH